MRTWGVGSWVRGRETITREKRTQVSTYLEHGVDLVDNVKHLLRDHVRCEGLIGGGRRGNLHTPHTVHPFLPRELETIIYLESFPIFLFFFFFFTAVFQIKFII